ncbi:MAG: hypothetical protein MRY83_19600 [Flavobacteriales bacterium]|nr:hypothetical protein [Flavobacteriales bacterium]
MKLFITILLLSSLSFAKAQMMFVAPEHPEDALYSSASHFNYEFIKRNNIQEIKGKLSYKADMQPIKETEQEVAYQFDQEGRPKMYFKSYQIMTNPLDTNLVYYYFDEEGKCDLVRRSEGKGFFTYHYKYDDKGRVSSYEYVSEKNRNTVKTNFESIKKLSIFSETYEYIQDDKTIKSRYVINDIGKKYKIEDWTYSEEGDLVEKGFKYVVTNKGERINYQYDFQGRILQTEITSNLSKLKTTRIEYEYDDIGNLIKELTFVNDKLKSTKEFLYNDILLLDAQLTRNEKSGTIEIIKYSYTFYE